MIYKALTAHYQRFRRIEVGNSLPLAKRGPYLPRSAQRPCHVRRGTTSDLQSRQTKEATCYIQPIHQCFGFSPSITYLYHYLYRNCLCHRFS